VFLSTHPVVRHKLTVMRSSNTPPNIFRAVLREITYHLGYEATSNLMTKPIAISVPLPIEAIQQERHQRQSNNNSNMEATLNEEDHHVDFVGSQICEKVSLIPILRSGLGMIESMLELLPMASVHHIGMYKVSGQHPVQYYNRLPKVCTTDVAYVLDPVIATSSTILSVVRILQKVW
jgi:uracil phosphoribosyltransferase